MKGTRAGVLDDLDIRRSDFVVEVGGGHEPFGAAKLIFDKFPFDNVHRVQNLVHAAPVVIADAHMLPLRDDGCDTLFASHIIEHLADPVLFIAEIKRCSNQVYLEFPSANRELMFAWAFHEWLVTVDGMHLTFYRNDLPQLFGDFFHANYDFLFDAWAMQRHLDLNAYAFGKSRDLTCSLAKVGAFEHVVETSAKGRDRVTQAPIKPVRYSWGQLAVLALQRGLPEATLDRLVQLRRRRRAGEPAALTQELLARLICARCRAPELAFECEQIRCRACDTIYEKRRGLFDFDLETPPR